MKAEHRRAVLALALSGLVGVVAGCDREPETSRTGGEGLMPVLVEQATEGPFQVERHFSGRVRPLHQVPLAVLEPGEVVAVPVQGESARVEAGQILLRLRSRDLELELEEATMNHESARLELEHHRALAEHGLVSELELEGKQTAAEISRTRLERLKLRRARLALRAPLAGLFLRSNRPVVGEWCEPGRALGRIIDPATNVVEVVVPAAWSEAERVRRAVLELGDGEEVEASVVSLAAEVDSKLGGRVLSLGPSEEVSLIPGATLGARLQLVTRDRAVTVPVEALVSGERGQWWVYMGPAAGEKGRVSKKVVTPGPSDGRRTVIEEGVEAGDWIVIASEYRSVYTYSLHLGVGR